VPLDDGLGRPGDGTFNTPPLVEAADTGPFFHNNSIETIHAHRPGRLDREQPDYLTSESRFWPSAAFTGRGDAGNCSTVACWPSHSRVSSTVSPSGNSSAS
jgi:hypothetical protein